MFYWKSTTATAEELPLLLQGGVFTTEIIWKTFTLSLYTGIIGFILLVVSSLRSSKVSFSRLLIISFFIVSFLIALSMRRFIYYLEVPLCILSGYFLFWLLELVTKYTTEVVRRTRKALVTTGKNYTVFTIFTFLVFMIPTTVYGVGECLEASKTPGNYMSESWEDCLYWTKLNTPEVTFLDSKPSYTTISWWDYGYYITQVANRCPVSNPGLSNRSLTGAFFTSLTENRAIELAKESLAKYSIVDLDMVSGKFYSMVNHAVNFTIMGKDYSYQKELLDTYQTLMYYPNKDTGYYNPVTVYLPNYFKSTVVRMYNFDCKEIVTNEVGLIYYKIENGNKLITTIGSYKTYEDALKVLETNNQLCLIGSVSPFSSCISLPALSSIALVYSSNRAVILDKDKDFSIPEVKVFSVRYE
jgi:asparagine N-glycosylation enzyme membrane subunit Stt3